MQSHPPAISIVSGQRLEDLLPSLQVNIIHNRFDILYQNYRIYTVDGIIVPISVKGDCARVGLYLTTLTTAQRDALSNRIFEDFPSVSYLEVSHSYTPLEFFHPETYWHIALPETMDDFIGQLSSKTRYNAKWYPKKLTRDKGEQCVTHYPAAEAPEDVILQYLQWKNSSHSFTYTQDATSFIKTYGITDIYTLSINGKNIAIGMTCDTGHNSYFENFSYDPEYHLYSPGMILYLHIIGDKIKNHMRVFYLSGGELDYKRRYNGIRTETYTGRIFRHADKLRNALTRYSKTPSFALKPAAVFLCFTLPRACKRTFRQLIKSAT